VPSESFEWIDKEFDLGFCLTFARGVSPDELLVRMGTDPDTLLARTRTEAEYLQIDPHAPGLVVRVGRAGEWAFGLESCGNHGSRDEVLSEVSRGTQALSTVYTGDGTRFFSYAEDGVEVCWFDVDSPSRGTGSDPNFLLPEMRAEGLMDTADGSLDSGAAMLRVIRRRFGVTLPKEAVLTGKLLSSVVR
jgi:hypothetical protein